MTALERAQAGAAFLDSRYKTWRKRVDPSRIDMSWGMFNPDAAPEGYGGCGCVLAQLDASLNRDTHTGNYSDRAKRLGLDYDAAFSLGFIKDEGGYTALTKAWKKVLS